MSVSANLRQHSLWSIILSVALLVVLPACTLTAGDSDDTTTSAGAPIVNIAAPADGATFADGVSINVQASISRAGEDIERVVLGLNGTDVETVPAPNPTGLTNFSITRTLPSPGMGAHIISVTAFRTDGSGSQAASVTVNVVDGSLVVIPRSVSLDVEPEETPEIDEPAPTEADPTATPTEVMDDDSSDEDASPDGDADEATEDDDPTPEPDPTDPPPPTATAIPTNTPLPPTPSVPTAIATTSINVRSGPGIIYDPPIGAFREGDSAEILATNPNGTWLKIRRGATGEGWVATSLVDIEGDITGLPREEGPPPPEPTQPPPPTAPPATAAPVVTNNLIPVSPFIDPPVPQCGQDFRTGITIRNDGSASGPTGATRIEVIRVSDGQILATSGDQPSVDLPPGGTHTIAVTFNIDVFINEEQRVRFIADATNQVTETIEDDNQIGITYTLPPCN